MYSVFSSIKKFIRKNNDQYNTDERDILWQQHPEYNKNNIMECLLDYVVMFVAVYEVILVPIYDELFIAVSDGIFIAVLDGIFIAVCGGGIFIVVYDGGIFIAVCGAWRNICCIFAVHGGI